VLGLDFILQEFNYLTFEEALIGAKDDTLHPAVRSKYVELIVGMGWVQICMCVNSTLVIVVLYVDVGDNRAILENLSFSFVSKYMHC